MGTGSNIGVEMTVILLGVQIIHCASLSASKWMTCYFSGSLVMIVFDISVLGLYLLIMFVEIVCVVVIEVDWLTWWRVLEFLADLRLAYWF